MLDIPTRIADDQVIEEFMLEEGRDRFSGHRWMQNREVARYTY